MPSNSSGASTLYYPPVGFSFSVLVDGIVGTNEGSFQEVSGLNVSISTEEIKEGGENRFAHQIPQRPSYEKLVLKRGVLTGSPLITWVTNAIQNFSFSPKTVIVSLLDETGIPLVTWTFDNAYPVGLKMSNLNAQENAVFCESIELAYNYFTRLDT